MGMVEKDKGTRWTRSGKYAGWWKGKDRKRARKAGRVQTKEGRD